MKRDRRIFATVVCVAIVVGTVFAWRHNHPGPRPRHHATCWTLRYAWTHNPTEMVPPPRHGRGRIGDVELCYLGT